MYDARFCYRCESAGSIEMGVCQVCGMDYPELPPDQRPEVSLLDCGETCVAEIKGEIDLATRGELEFGLLEALESGPPRLVVDLDRVDFMDTQGMHMLLLLKERAGELGKAMEVRCNSGPCLKLLERVGLCSLEEAAA